MTDQPDFMLPVPITGVALPESSGFGGPMTARVTVLNHPRGEFDFVMVEPEAGLPKYITVLGSLAERSSADFSNPKRTKAIYRVVLISAVAVPDEGFAFGFPVRKS